MRKTVTRKEILRALRTEPLKGGTWTNVNYPAKESYSGCAVCAVGAILDQSLKKKATPMLINDLANALVGDPTFGINDDPKTFLVDPKTFSIERLMKLARKKKETRGPLSALSSLFEALYKKKKFRRKDGTANLKLREILVKFVKKSFPKRITLDSKNGRVL